MPSCVYVIELAPEAGRRRDPRIPWVYVGSSARDPEIRFDQHRRGYRSSGLVKRFALRLRPDLYDDLEPFRGSGAARHAELARAKSLAECGFVAHCDGVSYGKGEAEWTEWDRSRVEPVIDALDGAIAELADSAFEPVDADTCGALLWGERAFWVADYLDQSDPPPSYGQFAHVRQDVLADRAAEVLPSAPTGRT